MNTAVKLNQLVKDRSTGTQLLVVNLPGAPAEENDWLHCILFRGCYCCFFFLILNVIEFLLTGF